MDCSDQERDPWTRIYSDGSELRFRASRTASRSLMISTSNQPYLEVVSGTPKGVPPGTVISAFRVASIVGCIQTRIDPEYRSRRSCSSLTSG